VLAHRVTSAAQSAADAGHEAERTEEHAERDPADDTDRRGSGEVVEEQTQQGAADDRADEEATETEEVTAAQRRSLIIIWHRPKLAQHAAPLDRGLVPREESRMAVVNMAAVLCQKAVVVRGGEVPANARERYHERA
jgi:hypothetical protein